MNYSGEDLLARLQLTGHELRDILECGARDAYYLLTISGGTVVYDGVRPLGERAVSVTIGGALLEDDRVYSVACSEILARGAAGFTPLVGKPYTVMTKSIRQLIEAHIFATGSIHPRCDGRLIIEGALPRARPRT